MMGERVRGGVCDRARASMVAAALVCGSCGGTFARESTASNTRADDPWLDGGGCSAPDADANANEPQFRFEDIEPGVGNPVGDGETVRIHYTVAPASPPPSGPARTLHDTRDGGPPIQIVIGSTKTICGFEKGIRGMRPGGQRRVFVPWRLAFGESGREPDVAPRTDLVFVIDLYLPADPILQNRSAPQRPPMPGRRR